MLVAAVYLYAAALGFASLAAAPFAAALHAALDGYPGAQRLVADGGIEAISEMSRSSEGFAPVVFGTAPLLLAVFLPLGLVLAGGAYGLVADRPERLWSGFWVSGTRRFPAYVARAALGAAYGAAVAAAAWGVVAGIAALAREPAGPRVFWAATSGCVLVLALGALHARTVLGFAFACREASPREALLPGFAASVALCWRRLPSTHGMGALFLALQTLSAFLGLAIARAAGEGGWMAEAATQAAWFGVAWLRAAEIRARITLVTAEAPAVASPRPVIEGSGTLSRDAEGTVCDL